MLQTWSNVLFVQLELVSILIFLDANIYKFRAKAEYMKMHLPNHKFKNIYFLSGRLQYFKLANFLKIWLEYNAGMKYYINIYYEAKFTWISGAFSSYLSFPY
jgi:hypothetical protein